VAYRHCCYAISADVFLQQAQVRARKVIDQLTGKSERSVTEASDEVSSTYRGEMKVHALRDGLQPLV